MTRMKLGTLLCEKKKWCDMSKALNNFRDEMQPIIKSKEKTMVEIYSFFSVYIYF